MNSKCDQYNNPIDPSRLSPLPRVLLLIVVRDICESSLVMLLVVRQVQLCITDAAVHVMRLGHSIGLTSLQLVKLREQIEYRHFSRVLSTSTHYHPSVHGYQDIGTQQRSTHVAVLLHACALVVDLKELLRELVLGVALNAQRDVRPDDNVRPEPSAEHRSVVLLLGLVAAWQYTAGIKLLAKATRGDLRTSVYAAMVRFGSV